MAALLSWDEAVDIGGGRGRLAFPAAASVRRIDRQLGRYADVNEAWRSPAVADANYAAWVRYQNGGPIAPYALPARLSIHCRGYAVDSDDWYNDAGNVWYDNGWRQTARYIGTDRDEPWHGEYHAEYDNHINDAGEFFAPHPWEDDMFTDDDRATLLSVQLALGAGGLAPGGIDDANTILQRLERVETKLNDIRDGTGTGGATAAELADVDTILGIVRELRETVNQEQEPEAPLA